MKEYKFENLEVEFDGTQEQADALRERVEALGYKLGRRFESNFNRKYLTLFDAAVCGFYSNLNKDCKQESFSDFMTRTEQYLPPRTIMPRIENGKIVGNKIKYEAFNDTLPNDRIETATLSDGKTYRVKVIEEVKEPLSAQEWLLKNNEAGSKRKHMEEYANYRLEFYKEHGV